MASNTSSVRRTPLKGSALTAMDSDMKELYKQIADGHSRAIEIQDDRGGHVAIRYSRRNNTLEVCVDGTTWRPLVTR